VNKMNVGIITFNSAHNYGAMLQTYALQTVIENKGFEVVIINYRLNMIDNVYNPFRRRRRNIFDLGFYKQRVGLHLRHRYKLDKFKNFDCISIREERSAKSLAECTDKPIKITADPTLLLEKKYYDEIKNDLHFKDKEYIFFYTLEHNDELIQIAESISKKENLPVIFNRPTKTFHNQLESVPYIGPKEFLGLIANAKYVVTNSYHGAIFSIIYEKTFITAPNTKTPTRTKELIDSLGLEQALFTRASDFEDISKIKINYRTS